MSLWGKISGRDQRNSQESNLRGMAGDIDPGPRPDAPKFETLIDPNTGLLRKEYNVGKFADKGSAYQGILDRLRGEADRDVTEKSAIEQTLENKLGAQKGLQLSDSIAQAAARTADARSGMAARRGLSSAAAERMATASGRDTGRLLQNIRAGADDKLLGINADQMAQREQRRQGLMTQLTGAEEGIEKTNLGVQEKNINAALSETGIQRDIKQRQYEEQMKSWAAGKQAQAVLNAGVGGKK